MSWLILTISCIFLWGITDIFYKKSSDYNDSLSQYKTFVWIGIVMAPAGIIMALLSETLANSVMIVKESPSLVILCIFYAIALLFGLIGKKHLDASVVSPLENIDGAMAAIILYLFFLFTNRSHITDNLGVIDFIATFAIILGIVMLGFQEHKLSKQEKNLEEEKKRHRLGAMALIFPIIFNLVDAISMVAIGITVSEETEVAIPDIDFFIFETLGFVLLAIFIWLYMFKVKKYKYNPFKKEETLRCCAATGETFGTMTFIFAVGMNPILTAPVTSSYCLMTIVLAHIILKERLTKNQYLSLAFLVVGIILLGISEIFKI